MLYSRILLKLSGEALGSSSKALDFGKLQYFRDEVKKAHTLGVQIGIVLGGGNIFRGMEHDSDVSRTEGDTIGMMATVVNGLTFGAMLSASGVPNVVFTAKQIEAVGRPFRASEAISCLANGEVAILSGGTGNPYFTTDTAAMLRALEIEAQALLKATNVDAVYDKDPKRHPDAKKYETVSYQEVLDKRLRVMDQTAFALGRDNQMPLHVYDGHTTSHLVRLLKGEAIGTTITT